MEQNPLNTFDLVVRTASDPNSIVAGVREAVRAVDSRQAIGPIATLDDYIARDLAQPRFRGFMLALFAALAVALASLGLYGVISYPVAQRTKEVGIRMALGATRWEVIQLILTCGGRLGDGSGGRTRRGLGPDAPTLKLRFWYQPARPSHVRVGFPDPRRNWSGRVLCTRASQLDPARLLQNER